MNGVISEVYAATPGLSLEEGDDVVILDGIGLMQWHGTSDDGDLHGMDVFQYDADGTLPAAPRSSKADDPSGDG